MVKTYRFAGVSCSNGVTKARFTNRDIYAAVLAKEGHTDIEIEELMDPMTRSEAAEYLLSINFAAGNTSVEAALKAEIAVAAPLEPKAPKAPRAKKSTAAVVAESQAPAVVEDQALEEAPY